MTDGPNGTRGLHFFNVINLFKCHLLSLFVYIRVLHLLVIQLQLV